MTDKAKKTFSDAEKADRLLSEEVIGKNNWGVIYNSVANLRSKPAHSSEMVSQLLLGVPIKILNKSEEWLRIEAPEGYIGWIYASVQRLTYKELKGHLAKPKAIVTCEYGKTYSKADIQSQSVSDIVIGNIFTLEGEEGSFHKVTYPDGRKGFVEKQNAQEFKKWLSKIELKGTSIADTAKQLMGVPYLWGGTSAKGLDCSGFSKLVYWLHGIIIPRDASQQASCGVEVDNKGTFENVQLGDLLFFGEKASDEGTKEKVVHVGIYTGNQQFIHASDYIRISSFNPDNKLFDKFNANRYLRTMRYIGNERATGITPVTEHLFYKVK